MKTQYPAKKLAILNLWLTSYFVLFGFVSAMASSGFAKALTNAIIAGVLLLFNSFINLAILLFHEKRLGRSRNGKLRHLVASYGIGFITYIMILLVYNHINNIAVSVSLFIYAILVSLFINTLILVFQGFIIIQDAKVRADIENSELKAANADAANQLLRQQIHPHFLFNALTILKSLYRSNPKAGEEYLVKLSDFLRAATSTNNIKVIPLKDEIKLCIDYLGMQKIRFSDSLQYTISITNETMHKGFVPSFSIQPLLENAIKHNELTEESPLIISIAQHDDRILVSNNLQPRKNKEKSTQSGLTNLSERYKLLSDDELLIEQTQDKFSVSIKILDNEDCDY